MLTRSSRAYALVKYSFGPVTASPNSGFTHRSDTNLCLVVENLVLSTNDNRKLIFRIVLRSETLESIPVQALAEDAAQVMQASQMHLYTKEHLPIWGVAKGTALALQYKSSNDNARRVQIRFQEKSDFESVLGMLNQLKILIELRDRPATTHGTAPISSARPQHMWTSEAGSSRLVAPLEPGGIGFMEQSRTSVPTTTGAHLTGLTGFVPEHSQHPSSDTCYTVYEDRSPQRQPNPRSGPNPFPSALERPSSHTLIAPSLSSSGIGTGRLLPSEIASNHVPPERQLPVGFPARPDSSPSERIKAWQHRAKPPHPPSRPMTRSRAGSKAASKKDVIPNVQDLQMDIAISELPAGARMRLAPAPRLDPPRFSSAYNFQRPSASPELLPVSPGTISPSTDLFPSGRTSPNVPSSPPSPARHVPFLASHPSAPGPGDAASLAAYAAKGDEERAAALDRFVCEHLRDEGFLKLCEDVDACWRRVGLNM